MDDTIAEAEKFAKKLIFVRVPFKAKDMLFARDANEDGLHISGIWDGSPFDESRFELVPAGWDHEHCYVCCKKIEPDDDWWTTHPPNYENPIGLCLECHARLFTA